MEPEKLSIHAQKKSEIIIIIFGGGWLFSMIIRLEPMFDFAKCFFGLRLCNQSNDDDPKSTDREILINFIMVTVKFKKQYC